MADQVLLAPGITYKPVPILSNRYARSAVAPVAASPAAAAAIVFDQSTVEIPLSQVSFLNTAIQIHAGGVYCVGAVLVAATGAPATEDLELDVYLQKTLANASTEILSQQLLRVAARGVSPGSDARAFTLDWTGYLDVGESVQLLAKSEAVAFSMNPVMRIAKMQ